MSADRLIELWVRGMQNKSLCAESRAHIEYVLAMEFLTL